LSYLVDTNAISELRRKKPDPMVAAWFAKRSATTLYLSVLTLGELRKGVEKVDDAKRRLLLTDWMEQDLPSYFSGRILSIDSVIADRSGRLQAKAGRPLPLIDSLLAATAQRHSLKLVTRNVNDFHGLDVEVVNPWSAV
jgi:toxin FitB